MFAAGERLPGIPDRLVADLGRVKMEQTENVLQNRSTQENGDKRPEPNLTTQQPATQAGCCFQQELTGTDGNGEFFLEIDEQGIARTGAHGSGNIKIDAECVDAERKNTERNLQRQSVYARDDGEFSVDPEQKVCDPANDQNVQNHAESERLACQNIQQKNCRADPDAGLADGDGAGMGDAVIEYVPGRKTLRLLGQKDRKRDQRKTEKHAAELSRIDLEKIHTVLRKKRGHCRGFPAARRA